MPEEHPDPQLLERFMRNAAEPAERRRVVRHLLAGCARCAAMTRRLWNLGEAGGEERQGLREDAVPLERGELHELEAGLRADQGRLDEAERLLDRALDLYRRLGERHLQGRVLVRKGVIRGWRQGEEAVLQGSRFLREGLARLDEAREPDLVAFAFHRLALLLAEGGRDVEALQVLQRARLLYQRLGDGPNLVRLRHLEGKIGEALGATREAETAFIDARQGFLMEGLGGEAAAALLDLAILYAREGRSTEIRRLAEDLLPILRTGGVRQGVAAALLFFRRLAETGQATLAALSEVRRYVSDRPRDRRPVLRQERG
jgi:tetratricopeptide (TPR) repeat protein